MRRVFWQPGHNQAVKQGCSKNGEWENLKEIIAESECDSHGFNTVADSRFGIEESSSVSK